MPPRQPQPDRAQTPLIRLPDLEARPGRLQANAPGRQLRLRRLAVGHHPFLDPGQQAPHARIVHAGHDGPEEGHAVGEDREGVEDVGEVPIGVEVIRLDVGDDGDDRRQREKRAVVFVGLGHEIVALAQARVGAQDVDLAADDDGGVESGLRKDHPRQRRRGRLAVGAGDGHALLQAHDLAEHLRPADHGDSPGGGGRDLGVGLRDG